MNLEWSDHVTHEDLERVLELGEALQMMPIEHRCLRLVLMASKLYSDGIARSQEEGYVMLMEAYAHAEVMTTLKWFHDACASVVPQRRQTGKDHEA